MSFFLERLDSESAALVPLDFSRDSEIVLGRADQLLGVDDRAVSRRQVALQRRSERSLSATVLGSHPSTLASNAVAAGDPSVELRHGDVLELLVGLHRFRLLVHAPASVAKRRLCPLGAACDRANPLHRAQFDHAAAAVPEAATVPIVELGDDRENAAPHSDNAASAQTSAAVSSSNSAVRPSPGWRGELQRIALRPEQHADVVQFHNDAVAVVLDKFPKAKVHLLVIARDLALNKPSDLRRAHLPLLREMQRVAEQQATAAVKRDPSLRFQIGVHAVPSMLALHVHVISRDFASPCLKNKKHFNSFTTRFFVPLTQLIADVEAHGSFEVNEREAEALLEDEMACPRCGGRLKTIPAVKAHQC